MNEIDEITDVLQQAIDALVHAAAWLDRWALHVGNCRVGEQCTCGLTSIRHEADFAIAALQQLPDSDLSDEASEATG